MTTTARLWQSAFATALLLAALPARADSVSGTVRNGYARLAFSLDSGAHVSARTTGGVLAIAFDRKTDIAPAAVAGTLPRLISGGRTDPDGKTLRFTLGQPVKLHVSQAGIKAVVDLADPSFAGAMPDLVLPKPPPPKPVDVAALPLIKLRAGSYTHFTRLVFDWPKTVPYTVFPGAGRMTVRFGVPSRLDVSVIARFPPPWVKNATWHLEGNSVIAEFETDSDSGYHDFRDGTHVVLDILAPKTDAAAYAPPGTEKPQITPVAGVSNAQAAAIARTVAQLNPQQPEPAKPADAKAPTSPATTAEVKTAGAKTADNKTASPPAAGAPPSEPEMTADGQRTRDGAVLNFKGAGGHGAAVFIRGLTAWIVVENAPAFDAKALEASLKDFSAGLEAVTTGGLSILRINIKAPAEIAARGRGPVLQVVIATKLPDRPIPIGFARNQLDPKRASLSTLLPAADKSFVLLDPGSGDLLTIIPAAPGRAMPQERAYADFAALPTASGLVLSPYVDDLSITVADARVTIGRPGGLGLTPPQMPVAQSPAALAHPGEGPSFLDFPAWAQLRGGSFLATERNMMQAIARLTPDRAGQAQMTLARFYLANGFAAEALGMIELMQTQDPSLKGDAQLTTMRAAADYLMGRYQDAHNELAGPQFDADRHAALWRGLIDAATENWKDAHTHLEQAYPVLDRYGLDWQARADLADTEAALGLGRLDIADAALRRMPKTLAPRFALEKELSEARMMAAESRYRAAAPLFVALENSGQEDLAAKAIFYHTGAALNAGAITPDQAIETLERLRFRWRGDSLEMKTLRKLASLYFRRHRWREGLKSLRVAQQNFSGDASRLALDDMRAAFVNLYLKGAADKMKPVEALAMFYDNIDLTPIGADGDEMIRRMADRLVAVDLLDPAASLLAYQVNKRLDGIAKAQISTRLAAVYLMDHKPDLAVKAIRDSEITGLPDSDMHDRLLLEARAFAGLKQWDNALDLVAVDNAPDTRRLRADIYWESGNWELAGQKSEELLDAAWSDPASLTIAQRAEALRCAVAYSLANDEASLDRIREHYGPKMKATADASLFAVLAADIDAHGLAFRNAAAQIAQVDTLQSFMKDFSKRHEMVATN